MASSTTKKKSLRLSNSGLFINVSEGFLSFDELAREAKAAQLVDANLISTAPLASLSASAASSSLPVTATVAATAATATAVTGSGVAASAAASYRPPRSSPVPSVLVFSADALSDESGRSLSASSVHAAESSSDESELDDGFVHLDVRASADDESIVHSVHVNWSTQPLQARPVSMMVKKTSMAAAHDDHVLDDVFGASDLAAMDSFGIPVSEAQYALDWAQEPATPTQNNSGELPPVDADASAAPGAERHLSQGQFAHYRFCEAFGAEPPPTHTLDGKKHDDNDNDDDDDADKPGKSGSDGGAVAAGGGGAYDESFNQDDGAAVQAPSESDAQLAEKLKMALAFCQSLAPAKMEALAKRVVSDAAAPVHGQGDFVQRLLTAIEAQREEPKKSLSVSGFNEQLDWNYRFQNCVEGLQSGETPGELLQAFSDLSNLAQDFIHSARTYGKIIISEVFLPDNEKTIRPVPTLGGFAGGLKYVVNRMMFKFAVDSSGLYGSDVIAAKAAGHDLKGVKAYFNAGVPLLNFPLVCLVDYMGFRLVAISLLPIGNDTIVYGSSDAGRNVHASDAKFNAAMELAAERLNIRGHFAGPRHKPTFVHSAADIEGHCGRDGRRYLIDLGRAMPPIKPVRGVRNAHLYRLFRPEFVRQYPKPLCSDGFSGFVAHDPRCNDYNNDLVQATNVLYKRVIPELARELDAAFALASSEGSPSAAASSSSSSSSSSSTTAATAAAAAATAGAAGASSTNAAMAMSLQCGSSPPPSNRSSAHDTPESIELNDVPLGLLSSADAMTTPGGAARQHSSAASASAQRAPTPTRATSTPSSSSVRTSGSAASTPATTNARTSGSAGVTGAAAASAASASTSATPGATSASSSTGVDEDGGYHMSTSGYANVLSLKESGSTPMVPASSSLSAALLFGGVSATDLWTPARIKDVFHAKGVNLCFIGVVRFYVHTDAIKMLLLIEMIARVIKIVARERIRNKMRELRVPLEQPYRRVVIDYLNTVFGNGADSRAYWAGSLKRRLHKSFTFGLSHAESQPAFDMQALFHGKRHMCTLFERVVTLSGFKFASASYVEFVTHVAAFAHAAPFDETDLDTISDRIKHMNIVAAAQAHALKAKTLLRQGDRNVRLLRTSVAKFRSALADNPHDKTTLVALADTLSLLGEFADADRYYVAALELDANDFALMFQYATFLERSHEYTKAETYFMKAFYVNPNEHNISRHIGDFLSRRGKVTEARTFYGFAKAADSVQVDEVFENERRPTILSNFTSKHMVRMPHFSDKAGARVDGPDNAAAPPSGWEWVQPTWIVDRQGNDTDEDGWRYAFSWSSTFSGRAGMSSMVRRRRWIRTRRHADAPEARTAPPVTPPTKLKAPARVAIAPKVLGAVGAMRVGAMRVSAAETVAGRAVGRDEDAVSHSPIARAALRSGDSSAALPSLAEAAALLAADAATAATVLTAATAAATATAATAAAAAATAAAAAPDDHDRSRTTGAGAVSSATAADATKAGFRQTRSQSADNETLSRSVRSSPMTSSSASALDDLAADDDLAATATQFLQRLEPGHPAKVMAMTLHGRTLWVGLADGSVYTWRSDKKSRQRLLGLGPSNDGAPASEPINAMCAVGACVWVGGSKLTVWNALERTLEATLEEHNGMAITVLQVIAPESAAAAAPATTTPRGNDGAGYRVVSGSLRASSLVVWDAERRIPLMRIAVHGERGPRRSCVLGSFLIIDSGRFLLAYDTTRDFAEAQRFRAHKSGLVAMTTVGRAQLWTTDGLTLTVWRRRSTGQIVEVSQMIDDCFDQRIHSLLRVRAQVWAGCSRSVVCWDARTLDPSQMLHGAHVESICHMVQVDQDHVWSVSDTDRCLCVWKLGANQSYAAGGAHSNALADSNPTQLE